ncbi:MAG: hypothetical protein ACW986_17395 [Promethearchaeota archaeon]
MSKNKSNWGEYHSILIILPTCFGNFSTTSVFCQDCDIIEKCKKIPLPKEPQWCNPE